MKLKQYLVIAVCAITGVTLWVLPRTALSAKSATQPTVQHLSAVEDQIELLKKELSPDALTRLDFYENSLKKALSPQEKAGWYDSLGIYWDKQMRPGIAAEYVYMRASITQTPADWLRAGKRFLGLSGFFNQEEKTMLAGRAVECLEKAYTSDSLNQEVQTNLGVAYTQSGENPMRGITLLKKITEKDPANFEAQFNLGLFSMQSGQYDKAVGRFRTAIQLRGDLPELRLYLSDALSGAGMQQEARKELLDLKKLTRDSILQSEADRRLQQLKNSF